MKKWIATFVVAAFSMGAALAHAAPTMGIAEPVISAQHGKHKKGHKKGTHHKHKKMHRSAR